MMARLIGIIGSTHGVRLSARPPRSTISRMASGPRPSNSPFSCTPFSALRMNCRKSAAAQVAARRAEDREVRRGVPRSPGLAPPARAGGGAAAASDAIDGAAGLGASPWPNAIAAEHVGVLRLHRRAGRHDAHRPAGLGRRAGCSTSSRRRPDSAAAPGRSIVARRACRRRASTRRRSANSRSKTLSGCSAPACLRSVGFGKDDLRRP